jgi:hypothetical protein
MPALATAAAANGDRRQIIPSSSASICAVST